MPVLLHPVLAGITPEAGIAGAASLKITATGTGFVPGDILVLCRAGSRFNLATTYLGPDALEAVVPAAALAAAGPATIVALDAGKSGSYSRPLPFVIGSGPLLASVTPGVAGAGSAAFTITVQGNGFAPGAWLPGTAPRRKRRTGARRS